MSKLAGLADTSLLVRYVTGDSPNLAERAAQILDGPTQIGLVAVVLVETAFVLERLYEVPRSF